MVTTESSKLELRRIHMKFRLQLLAGIAALAWGAFPVGAQSRSLTGAASSYSCKNCNRPTPFDHTEGLNVVIMRRDSFDKPSIGAVIRDNAAGASPPIVALSRGALTPEYLYRALATVSQVRRKYNGP